MLLFEKKKKKKYVLLSSSAERLRLKCNFSKCLFTLHVREMNFSLRITHSRFMFFNHLPNHSI